MEDLKFKLDDKNEFSIRVIGIALKGDKVLLHGINGKNEKNEWRFPGGSVKTFESSEQAIKREFLEELGENINIERVYGIVEDFFMFKNSIKVHQLAIYYLVKFNDDSKYLNLDEFEGIEDGKNMKFKWIDINSNEFVKPKLIFDELKKNNKTIQHYILNEL